MTEDEVERALLEQARQRVVEAAVALLPRHQPDDHASDLELRAAVRELSERAGAEA